LFCGRASIGRRFRSRRLARTHRVDLKAFLQKEGFCVLSVENWDE
jgi:hypothetical protein